MKKNIDDIIEGFVSYLVSLDQLENLPEIIEKLKDYVKKEENTAYITSAVILTEEEKEKICQFLKKSFGKDLEIKVKTDPTIGGGLIIRVGDKIIDQSLLGRLQRISEQLKG